MLLYSFTYWTNVTRLLPHYLTIYPCHFCPSLPLLAKISHAYLFYSIQKQVRNHIILSYVPSNVCNFKHKFVKKLFKVDPYYTRYMLLVLNNNMKSFLILVLNFCTIHNDNRARVLPRQGIIWSQQVLVAHVFVGMISSSLLQKKYVPKQGLTLSGWDL